jgi:Flp pilus assembly protein TadD
MTMKSGFLRRRGLSLAVLAMLALAALPAASAGAAAASNAGGQIAADRDYVAAVERIRAEDYVTAIALLEKAAERLPGSAEVFNYLGYTYRKVGREAAALAAYQRALFLAPNERSTRAELGTLYLERGEIGRAEEQLAEIDRLCFFSCREYRTLKARIDDFKKLEATLPGKGQAPVN